ncbi:B3 domain-containing protein Os01g0234100-like isoform X2 [Primulina tabacum]|uniref:B3 domain-containing protein Os01g0234100-like isoform X2 n=1 Tax=Primulina tabacum TaxID=48773 RepID=UPI003F59FF71
MVSPYSQEILGTVETEKNRNLSFRLHPGYISYEMKLKIVHQNQENREVEEQVMKKESLDMDQMAETLTRPSPEDESTKPNSPSREGKRKRKRKEMMGEAWPNISRNMRKKKTFVPKSEDGTPDCGGMLVSEGDASIGGSSIRAQFKSPTMIRAEEVQSSLGNEQPSFLKVLVRSHVASCFWMGLPVPFCKLHLPSKDTTAVLENETGEEFEIKYIAHKTGLSAGWRKFVAGNKIVEGDVLIFQLIGPCRFKVYIIRANDLNEVDGALSLLILDSQTNQSDAEGTIDAQSKKKRRPKSLPLTFVQKKRQKESPVPRIGQQEELSANDSEEVASEVLECSKFSGSAYHFKDVKSFEEFHIVLHGVCIDLELPKHIRRKYYDLCCSKNTFLHDRLLPGLSCKLASGMIFETVNTADAIRGCNLTTPRNEFDVWEKSLRSFELLGLKVGFLRSRLHRLVSMSFESEDAVDTRRYLDAKIKRGQAEEEIRNLEAKLVEMKELSTKYDNEIEILKVKAEKYELKFQEEANSPW